MSKNRGFTLVEVLVAFSILMVIFTTFIPINSILQKNTVVLSERRIISSKLHDELQVVLWDKKIESMQSFTQLVQGRPVKFKFTVENELIKGCAEWENVKHDKERLCLFGHP